MSPIHKRVTDKELRRLFKDYRILERLSEGELWMFVDTDRPAHPKFGQPQGTRSQMIILYDVRTRNKVALCHRFVKPDGTLGASGKMDPKRLEIDGVIYSQKAKPPRA